MPLEVYEQHLREGVLTPLQALKVGCIVVVLSGKAIWHEARTANPHKGHHETLEIPDNGDVAMQLKVLLLQSPLKSDILTVKFCAIGTFDMTDRSRARRIQSAFTIARQALVSQLTPSYVASVLFVTTAALCIRTTPGGGNSMHF